MTVLEGIPYMAWTYDATGALDYVNSAWTAFTGLRLADSIQQRQIWNRLLDPDKASTFIASLDRTLCGGESFHVEVKMKHRDPESGYRWHDVVVSPVYAEDGSLHSWIGTAIDVEERKRAESDLRACRELHGQELARATLFQNATLPSHLPKLAGLSFDAIYEPGSNDAQVGGDWYDALRLLDGRVLLTIGDVAGSGLKAAVTMGVVRQIIRGIAQLHPEPALMLDAADRALRLEYPDTLVTAWVGLFDLVAQTLTYASAGHPPPILIHLGGDFQELDHLTLPIGLRQGHQGHATTIHIADGDALWLYTDGLIEASHNIIEGSNSLHGAAQSIGAEVDSGIAKKIRSMVIPTGSSDDVALLVVKANFQESERHITRTHFDSGNAKDASAARRFFSASLSPKKFTDVNIANAEVVFGELCGNAARYAKGRVDVVVDSSGVQTVLHVLDRGIGFQHLSRLPNDVYSEKGRGLFIIAAMTTEFMVSQRAGGGSHARAVLVGRHPISLLRDEILPASDDQVAEAF